MKDLILRLLEIEEKAQTITADEEKRFENLEASLAQAEKEKRAELSRRAQARVEKMRSQAKAEAENRLEELFREYERETAAVKEKFAENGGRLSKQIYEEIIAL